MVIDPWGTVIAQAPDGVAIVHAELDLARVASIRRQIPVLANRRPEAVARVDAAHGPRPAKRGV
jgi:predicted amidohydrolase